MTKVEISVEPIKNAPLSGCAELRLAVSGHAGYAEKGKDIVCAAESVLVQALGGMMAEMSGGELYRFALEGEEGSGCADISIVPKPEGMQRALGAFECVCMGFCLLAKHYPKYVEVTFENGEQEKAEARF